MIEAFTALATTFGVPVACMIGISFFTYEMWKSMRLQTKEQIFALMEQSTERETRFFNQLSDFQAVLEQFQGTLEKIDTRLEYLEKYHERNSE